VGKFSLDDSITVKNEFKSIVDGSPFILEAGRDGGEGLYKYLGQKLTIRFLIHEMITVSSNLATNLLIELAGPENVHNTIRALGTKKMKVLRGVEDNKAFEKGLNNSVTASDLGLLFEKLASEEIIDAESCREMTDILLDQKFNDLIPAKLPKDVKVAHKTGSITGVRHDSGFVILPDGRKYVLVLLSKNLKDEKKAVDALTDISRIIYDYMTSKS
ncbi:MAG: serine hydrolase, partial [Syntrophothermus sp.]